MGKKSRRNNKKKGQNRPKQQANNNAVNLATVMANLSSLGLEDNINANVAGTETTAVGSDSPNGTQRCCHGCPPDQPVTDPKSFFHRVLHEYIAVRVAKNYYEHFGVGTWEEFKEANLKFHLRHAATLADPKFVRFVFAFCTHLYLCKGFPEHKINPHDFVNAVSERILSIETVRLGLKLRYCVGKETRADSEMDLKLIKWVRDSEHERGYVNILAREIPCNCMDASKARLRASEKTGICHGCLQEFPKHRLSYCKCRTKVYCSRNCQVKHWPEHKDICKMVTSRRIPDKYDWLAPIRDLPDDTLVRDLPYM